MVLAAMVACTSNVETRHGTSLPADVSPELVAIDSLMWRQPDSALALLCCRDVACNVSKNDGDDSGDVARYVSTGETFDSHYANLLMAELLYKNYQPQTNREELLEAVAYFDSLTLTQNDNPNPWNRHCGHDPQSPGQHDNFTFLDARAHYINGVGFYERNDVVSACAEYLKALEVMEEHFEEKTLTGKRTQFMANTYNRLGDLFSEQFMMESSISCYEKALIYCRIEPTSPNGISSILYRIGKQYDKLNEIDRARQYYGLALENIANTDKSVYRDIVSSKAVSDYRYGGEIDQPLHELKQIFLLADNKTEQLYRCMTIGALFVEEGVYDSALYYLIPVFENTDNILSQIQAAEYLRIVYDSIGELGRADVYVHFLVDHKKSEGENKALTSRLEGMFKTYMDQKQQKEAEEMREKSIRKTVEIIVPIAVLIALVIFVVAKRRSKKLLEDKERHYQREMEAKETEARKELEEKDKQHAEVLEAERQTHRMEQAAMSGRLKRSNQELRELKDQIKQKDDSVAKAETAASFNEEPVCRLIMERVNEGQFKAKIDCELYRSYALDKQHLLDLRAAADRHFSQFTLRLRKAYPKLTDLDIDYCCLNLLRLTHSDVSALMQRAYNTVVERDGRIQKIIGSEKPLSVVLMDIVQNASSI